MPSAWAGGLAIANGLGWTSTGYVGCGLALGGFAIWLIAMRVARGEVSVPADRSNRPVLSH